MHQDVMRRYEGVGRLGGGKAGELPFFQIAHLQLPALRMEGYGVLNGQPVRGR